MEGPGAGSIKTGSSMLDQIITVLLSTSMFVALLLGFILDNTIPGQILKYEGGKNVDASACRL
jgi:hypothetical protein